MTLKIFGKDYFTKLAFRMKRGDERAAEELYEALFSKVYGFCMTRVSNREIAEDLTQEIFMKLINRINTFDERAGGFLVWFWRVARNTIIDYYRAKKEVSFSDTAEGMIEAVPAAVDLTQALEVKLEQVAVDRFIKTLSEDEKTLFELRFIAELSFTEIAEILGKSEGSLRVAISRLRRKIRNTPLV